MPNSKSTTTEVIQNGSSRTTTNADANADASYPRWTGAAAYSKPNPACSTLREEEDASTLASVSSGSGNSGRGGRPPTDISAADSDSGGGFWQPQSALLTAGNTRSASHIMSYPEPENEPERREVPIARVSYKIRAIGAIILVVTAIALVATVSSIFLVLLLPAMLLVSERGEM